MENSWVLFKEALCDELDAREFEVVPALSPDALAYKLKVLELVCDKYTCDVIDIVTLLACASGDWRQTDTYQVCWDAASCGPPVSMDVMKVNVKRGLLKVLCNSKIQLWPRHRWVGFKQALKDVLLIQAIHGLLVPVYE
eukprot:5264037-Amphidinium_carterae.1